VIAVALSHPLGGGICPVVPYRSATSFILCALAAASCSPPQAVCGGTENCPSGDVCRSGRCVPPAAPTLATVDGDGSNTPVSPREGVDVPEGLAVGHRTRGTIVVTGAELDAVDACRVEQGGRGLACTLLPDEPNTDGATVRRIALPNSIVPGLMTLVLAGATGEARAQLFLLQGEPGPAGEGVAGVDALVDVRAAGNECPATGVLVVGGQDANRNGVLDDEEIGPSRSLCADANGAIDCAGGICTFASPIAVPGIKVAGNDVVQALSASVVVNVPADESTIAAALARFDDLRIPSNTTVTIRIAAGTHTVSTPLVVTHPDAARIRIIGDGRDTTTIIAAAGFVRVEGTALGNIDGIAIQGSSDANGIVAGPAGRVRVGRDVLVRGYQAGLFAFTGGAIDALGNATGRPLIVANIIGTQSLRGYINVDGAEFVDNTQIGVLGSAGFVSAARTQVSGSPTGLFSNTGSRLFAPEAVVANCDVAFFAQAESYLEAPRSVVDADTGFLATLASTIFAPESISSGTVSSDASSIVVE
jgi:hypothetical protein